MTECKIDHNADLAIPRELCRTCNPIALAVVEEPETPKTDYKALARQRRVQKLRAEERRLSGLIDEIGAHDPKRRQKLFDAIKQVETQIAEQST